MDPDIALSISLTVFYSLILLSCCSELVSSYLLSKKGQINLTFRLTFFLESILLCALRISQMLCNITLDKSDNRWVTVGFALDILGNLAFGSTFLTVLLIFTNSLKLQYHKSVSFVRGASVGCYLIVCLLLLSILIAFESLFPAAEAAYIDSLPPGTDPNQISSLVVLGVNADLRNLYRASFGTHGIFVFLLSTTFFVLGLLVYRHLAAGERAAQGNVQHHFFDFSLTRKILSITVVVSFCLLVKLAYLFPATFGVTYCTLACHYSIQYLVAEVIPLASFLVIMFISRRQITSQNLDTPTPEQPGLTARSSTMQTPSAQLDASKWLSDLHHNQLEIIQTVD